MFGKNMIYNEHDYDAIKILNNFLPDKIFDAHMHLYDTDFTPTLKGENNIARLDLQKYIEEMTPVLCNPKELRVNIIPYPDATGKPNFQGNIDKADAFLL